MRDLPDTPGDLERLPDFCSLPVLFALLLVSGLTVTVMLLAPGSALGVAGFSTAALFAVWLALLVAVTLCKLRRGLLRLHGLWPFVGVWLVIVAIVTAASVVVWWLDHALDMALTPASAVRFVAANGAIAALIGAALLRYFYVLAQWQARLAAVSRAQVQALQARIRPHFLFNSMNTVAALVRVDPAAAERTIEDLSELFRAALGEDGEGTLGEELALVDRYLAIEQWRLGGRLRVDRGLDALPRGLPLPRLLLQPLVENAVRHGIQPSREGGTVSLHGGRDGDMVEIVIANPLPTAPAATERGHGHGLDSVRRRIDYHFGARGSLQASRVDGRFVVTVRLPCATAHVLRAEPGDSASP
jgi:two-component system sensor histidine kinase AlgZ